MSAYELKSGSRVGDTDSSKDYRVRRFLVDTPNPDMALTDGDLPPMHSVYPAGNPNIPFPLIVDRYSVDEVGLPTHTVVVAHYTNDRRGRLNPLADRTRPTFDTLEYDTTDTTVDFYEILVYLLRVPGAAVLEANTPTTDVKTYKISESLDVITHSVSLSPFRLDAARTIGTQKNRIHKMPNGEIWLFKGGVIRQTEKSAWEVTYTWVFDKGTPEPTTFDTHVAGTYTGVMSLGPNRTLYTPPPRLNAWPNLLDPTLPVDLGVYIRSPYHIVKYWLPETFVPHFFEHCPYKYDPLGWQRLPGVRL